MSLPEFPEFSWSFTRQRQHEQCPRQYWFHYYCTWQAWPTGTKGHQQVPRQAYFLKNRETISTWVGKKVHLWIGRMLSGAIPQHEATEQAVQDVEHDWHASVKRGQFVREGNSVCSPKEFLLLEHVERDPNDTQLESARMDVRDCIEAMIGSKIPNEFLEARKAGRFTFIETELPERERFGIMNICVDLENVPGISTGKVWTMLDCAFEHESHQYRILDWKTGAVPDANTGVSIPMQLRLYALWLANHSPGHGTPEQQSIEAYYLYLPDLVYVGGRFSVDDYRNCMTETCRQASELGRLHAEIRDHGADVCPADPGASKCRSCHFRSICGDRFVEAAP